MVDEAHDASDKYPRRVRPGYLVAAGRTCPNCAEPLSIYYPETRCKQCQRNYNLTNLSILTRKVEGSSRALKLLAQLPPFEDHFDGQLGKDGQLGN